MITTDNSRDRAAFYDLLRIIAMFFVLFNHRDCYYYHIYYDGVSPQKTFIIALEILCKCGPPLFFMISGALLLGKQESFRKIFTHRIYRILVVMAVMTLSVIFFNHRSLKDGIVILVSELNWYLYAYLAYLVMLPFLRLIAMNMSMSNGRLFFIITAVFYSLDGICTVFGIEQSITPNLGIFTESWASDCWQIIFPLLGYLIIKEEIKYKRFGSDKKLMDYQTVLLIGSIISLGVAICFSYYDLNHSGGANLEQINQHAILFPSCYIFSSVIRFSEKHNNLNNHLKLKNICRVISETTFGIFLLETHTPFSEIIFLNLALKIPAVFQYITNIYSIIIEFVIYGFIIYLLRLINPVRKFI